MPYQNVPDGLQDKMHSCVRQVKGQGESEQAAIAICYAGVVKGEAFPDGIKFDMSLDDEDEEKKSMKMAIKAVGDWELDVLGVPFGGPDRGTDSDGQYFSPRTEIHEGFYKTIPAVYYHGFDPKQNPMGDPEIIGKAVYNRKDADGHWWRVSLDKSSDLARRVWEAAKNGTARASSGSVSHLARLLVNGIKQMYDRMIKGEIINWPVVEMTLLDAGGDRQPANQYAVAMPALKTMYERAGLSLPDTDKQPDGEQPEATGIGDERPGAAKAQDGTKPTGVIDMEEKDLLALLDARDARKAAEAAKAAETADIEALKAENAALKKAATEARRIPGGMPAVTKFSDVSKFDNYSLGDMDFVASVVGGKFHGQRTRKPSDLLIKAMITRLTSQDTADSTPRQAMKMAGAPAIKSDEVMQQDLTGYGDEWVGVGYGTQLWEAVRQSTNVVSKLPSQEIPQGMETFYDPTEGADPTWYKVPETTAEDSTMKFPVASVTSSKAGTGRSNETLAKAGARVMWSGELDEDSLIPMAGELRRKMALSGAENLEHAVIDGDTEAGATTNINDIGGTPAGTEMFMTINGFRKLALVTNTANSRSAAGGFVIEDFKNTMKLMGTAGGDALDVTKCGFIIDLNTLWKSLELAEVKTRDVNSSPTIEGGRLVRVYGYDVMPSAFMHFAQPSRLANSAGKIDLDTAGNNLYGSILGIRWDRWKFGWKRRATIETDRIARSDAYEIVALMRFGLKYYSTEAAGITYYVGV